MVRFPSSHSLAVARVLLSAGLLAVAGGAPGCASGVIEPHVINAPREPLEVTAAKPATPATHGDRLERLAEELDADAWQPNREWSPLSVWNRRTLGEQPPAEFRWRFHSVAAQDQLDALGRDAERYLRELSSRNNRVGANAAILLCRRNAAASNDLAATLEQLVNGGDPPSKEKLFGRSTRAAAAEAWVLVLRETHADALEAFAPAGLVLENASLDTAVRGELSCQLARWIAPHRIPRLKTAFQAAGQSSRAPVEIRRDAVLACLHHAAWQAPIATGESPWPETIWNARYDPDVAVRQAFVQWISIAGQKERAFEALTALTRDRDLLVQREAIVGLGRLDSQSSIDALHRLFDRPEEPVREAAVRGLCQLHIAEATRYLDDESIGVRRALASALADRQIDDAVRLLEGLIVDRDPSVQLAAAESCRSWTDRRAVPVLYIGLIDGYLATRQHCFDQLQHRTATVDVFPLQASRTERTVAARELFDRHDFTRHISHARLAAATTDHTHTAETKELRLVEVRQKWENYRQNSSGTVSLNGLPTDIPFNADEVSALEQILAAADAADQSLLLDVVLPSGSDEYLSLQQMTDESVTARRKAADRLAQRGGNQKSLSPYVVRVLRERLLHEHDRIVWQRAFAAIAPDDTDEAAAIALLALNHQWPDVRQLGCEFITRHPGPSRGVWLLPLLEDANATVQLAAIHAMGLCQNPMVLDGRSATSTDETTGDRNASRGLRPLLSHAQKPVRRATAIAMSRLGDRQAMQLLVQSSHDPDPQARIDAVAAMGESGQSRFVETLIHAGWTEQDAGVQTAIWRSLLLLVPEDDRPDKLSPVMPPADAMKVWMEWWKLQSTPVTTTS